MQPEFSDDQLQALQKVDTWLKGKDPKFFSLFGCAGTGKTTIARYLADSTNGLVYFASFTGKAAQVLRLAGCPEASTIHSLIYSPTHRSQKRLKEIELNISRLTAESPQAIRADLERQLAIEKQNASRPMFNLKSDSPLAYASLCIIDECSMIDEQIGTDLLSFGVPILALGDPGQLPPVKGQGFFTQREPDHLLTQIHRQAQGSPILKLATMARMGQDIPYGDYGANCTVVDKLTPEMALEADQIIVGRNKTRKWTNTRVRTLKGLSGDPVPGDRLVCLRNNHEKELLNGSLWTVDELVAGGPEDGDDVGILTVYPEAGDGPPIETVAHMHYFRGYEDQLPWYDKTDADEFDFGYAITAHKSQGSQWDHVLIIDESTSFAQYKNKWLYTAITRACKRVTIYRKP